MKNTTLVDSVILAQDRILKNLATCEKTIGELYELYGKCYPELSTFWNGLAFEEQVHGDILERVRSELTMGKLMRGLDHFSADKVQRRIDFVREKITEAQNQPPDKEQAVAIAYSIESSIIDSHFFDFAKSNGSEFEKAAHQLTHDTQKHMKLVNDVRVKIDQSAQNEMNEKKYAADHQACMVA